MCAPRDSSSATGRLLRLTVAIAASLASSATIAGCDGGTGNRGAEGDAAVGNDDAGSDSGMAGDDGATDDGTLPPGTTLYEPAISASPSSLHEHEPMIAVAPNGHAVVSWEAFVGATVRVGYRVSSDFGATWGSVTLLPLPSNQNVQGNAKVAAAADGRLFLAWGGEYSSAGNRTNQGVYLATAGPSDPSFGVPIQVTDPSVPVTVYDQPSVSVTSGGVIDVSYNMVSPDQTAWTIVNAVSTDLGASWSHTTVAGPGSPSSYRNEARVCVPSGPGRIYMSWVDWDVGGVALVHSDDDGRTWSPSSPLLVSASSEIDVLAFAGTDCVTHGSDVWVLYSLTDEVPTSTLTPVLNHLRLGHSADRGATVADREDIADPTAGAFTMNPTLVVESDGSLDLGTYQGRGANDATASFRWSRSTDGKTFGASFVVHQPLTLETSRAVPKWIGDYVKGTFLEGKVYFVYTDNAGPAPHISFFRATVP
jgi:hypothetical protein